MAAISSSLVFKAGEGAFDKIRENGFVAEQIGTLAGASGGAKWLVLSQLDRVILRDIIPKLSGPVHLIGSSVGAWRFACYAQSEPLAAIDRFEQAYLGQSYSEDPDIGEITTKSREMLQYILGENGVTEILANPLFRSHVMTVRSRHVLASEQPMILATSLMLAATLNMISRRTLGAFFERALFYDPRELPPFFGLSGFPIQHVQLSDDNLEDVIVATGSIPLVLTGVRNIAGATPGVYRDGGVIDYHLDIPHSAPDRLTLFPHFFDHIVPGWFDKQLPWRKPNSAHVDRTILVSPSADFVARLPNGKIPDRSDFRRYSADERVRIWSKVVASCEQLADEFHEVIEKDQLAARLLPL